MNMNHEKLNYKEPKISIVGLEAKDIIATSGNGWAGEHELLFG